ncbi:MAG: hypothetical protein V4503_01365 [Gemmatimonadota bacterium]
MSDELLDHLTADELDGLADGSASPRAVSHVATCTTCAELWEQDARLIAMLGHLPSWEPRQDFSDRVMAQVRLGPAVADLPWILSDRERRARRRVAVATVAVGGAFAGGLAWAAAHPAAAIGWSAPTVADAGHSLWITLQTVAANATEQPWFDGLRDALATPARAFPMLVGVLGAYALALTGLRRLLTEPATDAGL